ncbi:MAG: hypothetical protein JXA54_00890 [Candidatus Heimdallarchaeota archaeon]|nr:hypothetical protein [Candidatus Heimdallarchaeota archaeon]
MNSNSSNTWRVPAHITGIFQIMINDDPLLMGSRGAGFSINNSIFTKITSREATKSKIEVFYNNQPIDGKVSLEVASNFKGYCTKKHLIIEHSSQLPMQGGFGTSGAGALGTAFALNELSNGSKTWIELGQLAHKAEVNCRTGLGDVIAQCQAFAEMRIKPGAPGIGELAILDWPLDNLIMSIFLGPLPTKDIITDPEHIDEINSSAESFLSLLYDTPTVEEFVKYSYEFAVNSNLLYGRTKKLLDNLRSLGYAASMIMLGESIFIVGPLEQLNKCYLEQFANYPEAKIWINSLATIGPSKVFSSK